MLTLWVRMLLKVADSVVHPPSPQVQALVSLNVRVFCQFYPFTHYAQALAPPGDNQIFVIGEVSVLLTTGEYRGCRESSVPILVTFEEVPINIRSSEMGKNLYISWIGGLNSKGKWRQFGGISFISNPEYASRYEHISDGVYIEILLLGVCCHL